MAIRSNQIIFTLLGVFLVQVFNLSQGQNRNIKLVAMNGNQYWFSSSSPYAPTLNFHLAYQYCRTLGLQLATLETKEEVDLIASYLKTIEGNIGKEYWTSGNKLGSEDSWIWMSSGEQLNATFSEYWLQQKQIPAVGPAKDCMTMQASTTRRTIFSPQDCGMPLTFICEQLRCLYYNYPVTPFPDPEADAEIAALRADLEGTNSSPTASESRSIPHLFEEDALRIRNYLLHTGNEKASNHNLPYSLRILSSRPSSTTMTTAFTPSPQPSPSPFPFTTTTSPKKLDSGIDKAATATVTPSSTNPAAAHKYGSVKTPTKDAWTPAAPATAASTDLNYVTVKNVVVSKSEKVSYSSNYSNIHGVPLPSNPAHKAYQLNRQQQQQQPQQRPPTPTEYLPDIQVDSGSDHGNYRMTHEEMLNGDGDGDGNGDQDHEVTETIFYDELPHTDNYHFDDTTEVGPDSHNEMYTINNHQSSISSKVPIAVKMFQFHRSQTPVSWSSKTRA